VTAASCRIPRRPASRNHLLQLQEKLSTLTGAVAGRRHHPALSRSPEGPDLLIGGSNLCLGAVLARPECSDFLARDARTGKKVATVTGRNHLPPSFLLLWSLIIISARFLTMAGCSDNSGSSRSTGPCRQDRPQEADQPHCAIRKLVSPLMRTLGRQWRKVVSR